MKDFRKAIFTATNMILLVAFSHEKIHGTGNTPNEAFTDKYWKLETITVSPAVDLDMDGKPDTDMRILLADCQKDDAEMYKSNNKVMKHEGSEKCDEEDPQESEVGTWKYDVSTKKLTLNKTDYNKPEVLTVKEVSSGKLVLTGTFRSKNTEHLIHAVYKAK